MSVRRARTSSLNSSKFIVGLRDDVETEF